MCIGLNKEKGSLFACKGYDVAYTDHFKSKEDIKIDDMFLTLVDSRTNLTKSMVKYSEQISAIEYECIEPKLLFLSSIFFLDACA